MLKDFSDYVDDDTTKCDFLTLYNEICQRLEDSHNLDPITLQNGPINFNITKCLKNTKRFCIWF